MNNPDVRQEKLDSIRVRMSEAIKANDSEALGTALNDYQALITTEILDKVTATTEVIDSNILAQRGTRQLTSKETKYYNEVIKAMNSADPKAAIANISLAFPETTITNVIDDLKANHPLLSIIDFKNTTAITKWVYNTQGEQTAVWGELTDPITKELHGSIAVANMTLCKLTAFMYIAKDLLDLGPRWLDTYVRNVLSESIAVGLETGIVDGNGKNMPTGMTRQVGPGVTITDGIVPRKSAIKVTSFDPATYGYLLSLIATTPTGRQRPVNDLTLIVSPVDYYKIVFPATTNLTPSGEYVKNILPERTNVVQSAAVPARHAILGLPKYYFAGIGMTKDGKIEYSDEYKFLEDIRTYAIKTYGNGLPKDNTAFLYLDIDELTPTYPTSRNINVTDEALDRLTVTAEAQNKSIFGVPVSSIQSDDVVVAGNSISGSLKYIGSGTLATDWGPGYFLALKFANIDSDATSVKVGIEPTQGSGLVEIVGDPDMNGVFKITNKATQNFKVIVTDGVHNTIQTYDLRGLTMLPE